MQIYLPITFIKETFSRYDAAKMLVCSCSGRYPNFHLLSKLNMVLPVELKCACYGGLTAEVTVAFLRSAGAIRERRMTPNQKVWIPAHRCF